LMSSTTFPGIPVCTGVVSAPVLRSDGTIADKRGYDQQTGLFLDVEEDYPPVMPKEKAVELLDDIFADFPFQTAAHKSGAIATLITLFCRPAFEGCAPLFLVDANTSGTGKGLLTDTIAMIFEGLRATRYALPKDPDELRKKITAAIIAGVPYVVFENLKTKLGGATLEGALTATRWQDRLLGANKSVDLPICLTWLANGNNVSMTGDMPRRIVHVRLESKLERPDTRTDFRHLDLLDYVSKHRSELIVAALSIPAGFIKDGRTDQKLPAWGGFEAWSDLVRSSIVWAGLPDCDSRVQLREVADDETDKLAELIEAWAELPFAANVATALTLAESGQAAKLSELVTPVHSDKRSGFIGTLLRTYRGRVFGGRKIERTEGKPPKWQVVKVEG